MKFIRQNNCASQRCARPDCLVPSGVFLRLFLAVLFLFAGLSNASFAADPADNFPGTTISGSGATSGDSTGATGETGETSSTAAFAPLNSLWYTYTPATAGTLVIQTCGASVTSYDTTLAAYTGATFAALVLIQQNDDTPGCATAVNAGYGSRLTLQVSAGTPYRIQLDGYGNGVGTSSLQYAFTPAAINVAVTGATATEGGTNGAFTVVLATVPSANTTVTINPDVSGQCTFAPTTLTFTPANYNVAQTVTVTAVNDLISEATTTCTTGAITAAGSNYLTVTGTPPTFTVIDNDQGVLITNTVPTATEGGATGAFTARLSTLPTGNVTVTIAADASGQCTFAPTTLTFTVLNWNVAQTVTTTAVNDVVVEGTHSCTTGAIVGNGGGYVNAAGTAPTFTITDNDVGTITIVNTLATATEGGATGAFTAKLGLQPSGTVTVTIAVDASGQCTFSPTTLTFTTANWNTAQTVTTTAVNDLIVEGAHSCTTGAISASGGSYTGVTGTAPTFTITDNDVASITVTKTANVGSVAAAGNVINYSIVIRNTGNVNATAISVSDTLTSVTCPTSGTNTIAILVPAASETCTASYTATQANFDNNGGGDGDIDNTASAAGTSGGVAVNASNSTAVLCTQVPHLTMVKSADATAMAGNLTVGQVVTYYFNVTNDGNVTITNVAAVETAFNGNGPALSTPIGEVLTDNAPTNTVLEQSTDAVANNGIWTTLKPNDSVRFQVNYTVTQADIDLL